jgi:hypothetical protein
LRQQGQQARRRGLKAAFGLGAALASLAFAGAASAAVIVVQPDNGTGTDHLAAAIATANTNGAAANTIVMEPGTYQPATEPITISKNLTIAGDHSLTSVNSTTAATIQGAKAATASDNNLFVVPGGVTFRLDAIGCDGCGGPGFSFILDNGHVVWNGVETTGDEGHAIRVSSIGSAVLNDSGIEGNLTNSIDLDGGSVNSSLTMNNVSLDQGSGDGIDIGGTPYTLNLNNTLLAFQTGPECNGGAATNGGPGSLDDDGTCGVQHSDDTNIESYYPLPQFSEGGPTIASYLPANNPDTTDQGVNCPLTDQRFFLNPVVNGTIQCDIGATTIGATQDVTPPTCTVTNTNESTTPATQQVTLQDKLSGIGPQPLGGLGSDNPTNTVATAYPPPAPVSVPGYSVSNLQISNGTVAFTPLTADTTSPLVLTASKTTSGTQTAWSFTGINWAGISKNCV